MGKDLNTWTGVGRLGRDVEHPSGNGPARFSIAVNRRVKSGEEWIDEPSWIDIEYWHKSLIPYLKKGVRIGVEGELRQDRWTDRETNTARSKLVILAREIELLDGRGEGGGQETERKESAPAQRPATAAAAPHDDFPDDIPF